MKRLLKDKALLAVIAIGLLLVGIVAYVLISSNQTIRVYVPAQSMKTGDIVTEESLYAIDIPASMPGNFLMNKNMVIGYRLKNSVEKDQLLYASDFLASWESYNQDLSVPEDYVITSVMLPDNRACGGLIVAGDKVDLMLVSQYPIPSLAEQNVDIEVVRNNGDVRYVYYVLANVQVINTNSTLSESQGNDLSAILDGGESSGSYYMLALSYEDTKKLRAVDDTQIGLLWMNICPRQNDENEPMIEQMVGMSYTGLHDSQVPVQGKDGAPINSSMDNVQSPGNEGNIDLGDFTEANGYRNLGSGVYEGPDGMYYVVSGNNALRMTKTQILGRDEIPDSVKSAIDPTYGQGEPSESGEPTESDIPEGVDPAASGDPEGSVAPER